MQMKNFTLRSNFDDLPLHGIILEPTQEAKGVLQILHGMGEYKNRYEEFMRFFANAGYVVVCHDHRGHGESVLSEEDRGYFYETSGTAVVEDSFQVTQYIKENYPDLPVYLFGHSMGSMISRCYLHAHDDAVDKVIVCGSPSKNPMVGAAIGLSKCIGLFRGKRHRSKMLAYLSTGKGNKNFPGEGQSAWLSQNRKNIEAFRSHPFGNVKFTCNGFENLFRLMKNTYDKKRYGVKNPNLPIYFVSGSEDPVMVDKGKWLRAIDDMKAVGYTNVGAKLYEGMRHEIFNELDGEIVMNDLLEFLQK